MEKILIGWGCRTVTHCQVADKNEGTFEKRRITHSHSAVKMNEIWGKKRRNTHSQPTDKNVDNLEKGELPIPKLQQKTLQKIPTPICSTGTRLI